MDIRLMGARLCRPRPAAALRRNGRRNKSDRSRRFDVLRLVEDDTAALRSNSLHSARTGWKPVLLCLNRNTILRGRHVLVGVQAIAGGINQSGRDEYEHAIRYRLG